MIYEMHVKTWKTLKIRDRAMDQRSFFFLSFFKRSGSIGQPLGKAKFYLVNPSNPAKTEKTHGLITSEQEINLVQIPHPSNATFKPPPPGA